MLRHAGDTLAAQPSGATATVGRSWFYSVALESLTPSRNRVAAVARLIFSQLESAQSDASIRGQMLQRPGCIVRSQRYEMGNAYHDLAAHGGRSSGAKRRAVVM